MGATAKACRSTAAPGRNARWARFNLAVVLLWLGAMLLLVGGNLLIDPYSVFGSRLLRDGPLLNERVVKFLHLSRQSGPVDVLLTGSSVMGVVQPDAIAAGRSSFNLSFFSATPGHIHLMLRSLERINRLPPIVVIGIDPFMLTGPDLSSAQMRLPPEVSGVQPLSFWRDYLISGSLGAAINKVFDHFSGRPGVEFDRHTGAYRLAIFDAEIARDHGAHMRKRFSPAATKPTRPDLSAGFNELDSLAAWLHQHQRVRTVWVLQPIHRLTREALGELEAAYHERALATLGHNVVDLTDQPMTTDDRHWYEPKHYRPEAAALIVGPISSAIFPTPSQLATLQ